MKLLKTYDFHGFALDCYEAANPEDAFWATREQIGQALNYRKADYSIRVIHEHNQKLLENLSLETCLNVRYKGLIKTTIYNFQGLIELCGISHKSRAHELIAFLWQIKKELTELSNTGTSKQTQLFHYGNNQVRVTIQDEQPWWIAKDVCDALGLTNSRMALEVLDSDEKGVSKVYTLGGEQEMSVINESGLYTLIMRSNKPEAKIFKRWITHEVLPSIRKTGCYDIANSLILLKDKLNSASTRQEKRAIEAEIKTTRVGEDYTQFYKAADIARELDISEYKLLSIAREKDYMVYGFTDNNCDWCFTEEGREKLLEAGNYEVIKNKRSNTERLY